MGLLLIMNKMSKVGKVLHSVRTYLTVHTYVLFCSFALHFTFMQAMQTRWMDMDRRSGRFFFFLALGHVT